MMICSIGYDTPIEEIKLGWLNLWIDMTHDCIEILFATISWEIDKNMFDMIRYWD